MNFTDFRGNTHAVFIIIKSGKAIALKSHKCMDMTDMSNSFETNIFNDWSYLFVTNNHIFVCETEVICCKYVQ